MVGMGHANAEAASRRGKDVEREDSYGIRNGLSRHVAGPDAEKLSSDEQLDLAARDGLAIDIRDVARYLAPEPVAGCASTAYREHSRHAEGGQQSASIPRHSLPQEAEGPFRCSMTARRTPG
jgi:hypothetical protein